MRQLNRLLLLALPVIAALGLAGVANAAPAKTHASNVADSRAAALARAESMVRNTAVRPAAGYTNYIANPGDNLWSGGLGVIHVKDGSYTYGNYDALLPTGTDTYDYFGWSTTSGWYTGPGYCTIQFRSDDGGSTWTRQVPDLGSGQHFIGGGTSYLVYPYPC
jgi:photosystem II stability/assembly factor-like uncharacterized protein